MTGIHDVFPEDEDKEHDPILYKKLCKLEGESAMVKDILGFAFDGNKKTMRLEQEKLDALLDTLSGWLRQARRDAGGIPFAEFQSVISKLRHAFTSIPAGKGLLSPCNGVLRVQPEHVYLRRNDNLREAIGDSRVLLQESAKAPTPV